MPAANLSPATWRGNLGGNAPGLAPLRVWGFGVAVGIHLLVLAFFLWRFAPESHNGARATALVVQMTVVAEAPPTPALDVPSPRTPPRPVTPAPDTPRRAPQPAQAVPLTVPEAPAAMAQPDAQPDSNASPSLPPEAAPAAPVQPVGVKAVAPLEAPSVNTARTGVQETWETQVLAHLERMKRYPATARLRRQEDVVYVRFSVDRQGAVSGGRIVRSQGFPLLDEEVLNLLKRAAPLPPMPNELPGERVEMLVPVEFFMRGGSP